MNYLAGQEVLFKGKPQLTVTIVGCGATGSHVAEYLAPFGFKLILYDGDTVEVHNIGNQAFSPDNVGENKAIALANHLTTKFDYVDKLEIEANPRFITAEQPAYSGDIFILAVDSLEARKIIGSTITSQLILCPGVPAHINDDMLFAATWTVEVFNNDWELFNELYLSRYENADDEVEAERLSHLLAEYGKACKKQSFKLLIQDCAIQMAKICIGWQDQPDLIQSAKYDGSAVIPFVRKKVYDHVQ